MSTKQELSKIDNQDLHTMEAKSFFRRNSRKNVSNTGPLAKLRFYCQQCSKQCRDANALNQHNLSPQHTIKTARMNPETVASYDEKLTGQFIEFLRRNGGLQTWQEANKIYNKFIIVERDHVHMVSTSFTNLSQFLGHISRKPNSDILLKKPEGGEDLIEDGEYSKYMVKLADNSSKNRMIENELRRQEDEKKRVEELLESRIRLQRAEMEAEAAREKEEAEECDIKQEQEAETNTPKQETKTLKLSSLINKKISLKEGGGRVKKKKSKGRNIFE